VPRRARRGPIVADRFVGLAGAPAARDLGGYLTVDGQRVRWGRLYRASGLDTLDDGDRARLAALGLPARCPDVPPGRADGAVDDADVDRAAAGVVRADVRRRHRALLRHLARGRLPQWVHCTTVDERLGWPAALVLVTLGVPRETAVADHLLGARAGDGPPPDRRALDAVFEAVRRRYRTFGRYLSEGLGLDQRTYLALRARLLTPDRTLPAPEPAPQPFGMTRVGWPRA
jgi:protein-tyrosine phosphatase